MAGYFEKLNGHVYEGEYVAGEELTNGCFVVPVGNTVAKVNAANLSLRMRVIEKGEIHGIKGVRLVVTDAGSDEVYFVENEWDINDTEEYDETLYTIGLNEFVRMRRPQTGDVLLMSVSDATFAALAVDNIVEPTTGGTIVVA